MIVKRIIKQESSNKIVCLFKNLLKFKRLEKYQILNDLNFIV